MQIYKTKNTCSTLITFDVTDDLKLTNVKFTNGCKGNLTAISRLVEGKPIDEVISLLKGVQCRAGTSCSDQLATALIEYKRKNGLV